MNRLANALLAELLRVLVYQFSRSARQVLGPALCSANARFDYTPEISQSQGQWHRPAGIHQRIPIISNRILVGS